ncbi:MAG: hypothetical protein WAW61_17795 [Methylococcaceae bacterium]
MKRNSITDIPTQDRLMHHKECIAYHEAGHAAAIYLNNKTRNLPPVYFQIVFEELNGDKDNNVIIYEAAHDDNIARVEGGRLIQSLPCSIESLTHKLIDNNEAMMPLVRDYLTAFETDIINLLVGPLAEAKHVYNRDDELFNHKLVNLGALKNYGGGSDLALVREYLESFSESRQLQDEKLNELFIDAFAFINDCANWKSIMKLANYILKSDKKIISCEEVVSVLE